MKKLTQHGFGGIELLLILLFLAVVGFGGYYIYSQNQDDDGSSDQARSETVDTNAGANNGELETTSVSSFNEDVTVAVQHSADWEVYEGVNEFNPNLKEVYIKSDKGNFLHLFEPDGLGGGCFIDDQFEYTVVKKLPTATPDVFFTEYTTTDPNSPNFYLKLEDLSNAPAAHKALKEGESNTGVCFNQIGAYSWVVAESAGSGSSVYVTLNQQSERTSLGNRDVPYAEFAQNPEFIDMLQSLTVTR